MSDLRKTELFGWSPLCRRSELFWEKLFFEMMENEKNIYCFASLRSDCWKNHLEIDFHHFSWMAGSSVDHMIFRYSNCGSRMWSLVWGDNLIGSGEFSRTTIISVVPISTLEIMTSSPLFWSIAWSSSFVVVPSKRDVFLGISLVVDSFLFFVLYLLAGRTWGTSACAALIPKSCSLLPSLLVWIYCSRVSFYSINSTFL